MSEDSATGLLIFASNLFRTHFVCFLKVGSFRRSEVVVFIFAKNKIMISVNHAAPLLSEML